MKTSIPINLVPFLHDGVYAKVVTANGTKQTVKLGFTDGVEATVKFELSNDPTDKMPRKGQQLNFDKVGRYIDGAIPVRSKAVEIDTVTDSPKKSKTRSGGTGSVYKKPTCLV